MGEAGKQEITLSKPFEIQLTPVTQLQWVAVMGGNPSRFVDLGKEVTIDGVKVKIDPNRPVEKVSWKEIDKFT